MLGENLDYIHRKKSTVIYRNINGVQSGIPTFPY